MVSDEVKLGAIKLIAERAATPDFREYSDNMLKLMVLMQDEESSEKVKTTAAQVLKVLLAYGTGQFHVSSEEKLVEKIIASRKRINKRTDKSKGIAKAALFLAIFAGVLVAVSAAINIIPGISQMSSRELSRISGELIEAALVNLFPLGAALLALRYMKTGGVMLLLFGGLRTYLLIKTVITAGLLLSGGFVFDVFVTLLLLISGILCLVAGRRG